MQAIVLGRKINGYLTAGPFWSWVSRDARNLFNERFNGLSGDFISRLQRVFNRLKLNVDLSLVTINIVAVIEVPDPKPGRPDNMKRLGGDGLTDGYDITLTKAGVTGPRDKVIGLVLHELGHVVQFAHAPNGNIVPGTGGSVHYIQRRLRCEQVGSGVEGAYYQDSYLTSMPFGVLTSKMHLLVGKMLNHITCDVMGPTLEAQAGRFSDLMLWLPAISWR